MTTEFGGHLLSARSLALATALLIFAGVAHGQTPVIQIACGYLANDGSIDPAFIDADYSGGTALSNTNPPVDTTAVSTDFYPAVYHNERNGNGSPNSAFTYTLPGLTAGQPYTLSLHFAEIVYTAANQRQFNVSINGILYLSNFDIFAEAGAAGRALVKNYIVTANSSGQIVISFSAGAYSVPKVSGIEVFTLGSVSSGIASVSAAPVFQIGAGSSTANSPYSADADYSGGTESTYGSTITTSAVNNPAPAAVYRADRVGPATYTLPGLVAGQVYTVRLHFAEKVHTAPAQRQFNVAINNTPLLKNFDILAEAGGPNLAIVKTFPMAANSSGQIVIQLTSGAFDSPVISGVEVVTGFHVRSGGAGASYWEADQGYNLGAETQTTAAVSTTGVVDPAPAAVYAANRYGGIYYFIHNLTPGYTYGVRLHFAELYGPNAPGWRELNAVINGVQDLTNFDIFANAGEDHAIVEQFPATADSTGLITIAFTVGATQTNGPCVSAIELVSGSSGSGGSGTALQTGQYLISGFVYAAAGAGGSSAPVPGATLNLTGSQTSVAVSASDGSYSFVVNSGGNYQIAAQAPTSLPFHLNGPLSLTNVTQNVPNQNFTATFQSGGSLVPTAPNKEYIFLNGAVVAVEHPH